MHIKSGQLVGRYRVDHLIGAGGISQVYAATHTQLGSRHALKFLTLRHPELQRSLLSEGRAQAKLRHPNIVQVTDVVRHAGCAGLVMEYIDGSDLGRWLGARGAPPVNVALDLFAQILAAVEEAHSQDVLHCDLNPATVLMSRTSHGILVKVADFGLGQMLRRMSDSDCGIDMPPGTPGYVAPEQLTDPGQIGPHTDAFGLGALLYELLSGQPAFPIPPGAEDPLRVTLERRPRDVRDLVPGCPDYVADVVMRALDRDPQRRFFSAAGMRAALSPSGAFRDAPLLGWSDTPDPPTTTGSGEIASQTIIPSYGGQPRPPASALPTVEVTPGSTLEVAPTGLRRYATAAALGILLGAVGIGGWWVGASAVDDIAPSAGNFQTPTPPQGNLVSAPRVAITAPPPVKISLIEEAEEATPPPPTSAPPPAEEPAPDSPPDRASEPAAEPELAAEPEPVVDLEPVAVASAEPLPPLSGQPLPEAAPEPETEPEPTPEPAVEPEPEPEPAAPELVGSWSGRIDGRPFTLVIAGQDGEQVHGSLRVFSGNGWRNFPVQGRLSGGALALSSGRQIELRATLRAGMLVNGFLRIGRMENQGWTASR